MLGKPPPWLHWAFGMSDRRKLGDVAMDVLLFAGVVGFQKPLGHL